MNPSRWQRVKEIFTAASALPESARRAYLDAICGTDAELLAEVESLLTAHAVDDAILDRPAAAHIVGGFERVIADRWLGKRIGAYEITALIGHGGMGQVFRARRVDTEFKKEVAIKLVPGGYQANYVLQRLRAERQILANLEHPNIARLIDGGATDDGSPYLVMELVEGQPLDRYAERHSLSIRECLRLFRDVCAAVSYAHQHLVIHRDLKPSNILVTAEGTVKLLDFGIAKLLHPDGGEPAGAPTVTVMAALTPSFASPEQVLGKPVTTVSDVYSLGVVLYLLTTGRSPYRSTLDSAQAAIREVCETEPMRPSAAAATTDDTRRERVDRDLDAIVLHALRKEPESRYASVEQLSEDVRRYLGGLPVRARGDDRGYRTRKFLRRHKLEIAAAAIVAVALVGATAVSLHQARIAAQQALLAEQQRERAERHFTSVRELADVFMFDVHDAIAQLPGSTEARALLVNTALEYLNTLAAEAAGDRELQQELAAAYEKVAGVQGQAYAANTGEPRAALESYEKAIALLEPIAASDPADTPARVALALDHLRASELLLLLGNSASASSSSQRAVAMFEALVEDRPEPETRRRLALAYSKHSYTLDLTSGYTGAGTGYAEKAVAMLEDLTADSPDDLDLASDLSAAYNSLGRSITDSDATLTGQERALAVHRKARALNERLVAATGGGNTNHVDALLGDWGNSSIVLYEMRDYRGAAEAARTAQTLSSRLVVDTNNAQARLDATNLVWPLARALLALGEIDEAEKLFEQNAVELADIARESDTLKVQFLLGGAAWGLGNVHTHRASTAVGDSARLEHWRLAQRWFAEATRHFARVTAAVTLGHIDQRTVDESTDGSARAAAEIAKLESASAARRAGSR